MKLIIYIGMFIVALSSVAAVCDGTLQNGICYPCDAQRGYLEFKSNGEIICNLCDEGYMPLNQNCVPTSKPSFDVPKNQLNGKIDEIAGKIANVFKTQNLIVGYIVLLIIAYVAIYHLLNLNRRT